MKVIHLSAECYPAAKVGGLADVVGSLPKYLQNQGVDASVIMPKYNTDWLNKQEFETVSEDTVEVGSSHIDYAVQLEKQNKLGFPLYVVDIPEYFNRKGIYGSPETGAGYDDEAERFIAFQKAALQWIKSRQNKPDVIHCHDHHTGLIPFMMTQCKTFTSLKNIPTALTVHNAEYQGVYFHDKQALLPDFNIEKTGLLDWGGMLNSLAAGLKCCWQITTVSPSYMQELKHDSNGLEWLFAHEEQKSRGILNGIDADVWNPQTDPYVDHHYSVDSLEKGKAANKAELCKEFNLDTERPLVAFIGRLVREKGADLLPQLFTSILKETTDVSFLVLGTGDPALHARFKRMSAEFVGFFDASLNYNEKLAHQIYAGSDFMIMPSRVEPCGLNQMYAMRYGSIPIVHRVGGLKDTVRDISKVDGSGIGFTNFRLGAAKKAVKRAIKLYQQRENMRDICKKIMQIDYSWSSSAKAYIEMYNKLAKR